MEKRIIFYLKPDNNYIDDIKIYNTFVLVAINQRL